MLRRRMGGKSPFVSAEVRWELAGDMTWNWMNMDERWNEKRESYHKRIILWVVKVERFQWNERPSCAHATSKQCCVQLVSSKLVFFQFFDFFVGFALPATLCDFVFWLCLYHSIPCFHDRMKGQWKEMRGNERRMKGNERKWKEHERNMKANESKGLGFDTLWRRSIRGSDVVRTSFETANRVPTESNR